MVIRVDVWCFVNKFNKHHVLYPELGYNVLFEFLSQCCRNYFYDSSYFAKFSDNCIIDSCISKEDTNNSSKNRSSCNSGTPRNCSLFDYNSSIYVPTESAAVWKWSTKESKHKLG